MVVLELGRIKMHTVTIYHRKNKEYIYIFEEFTTRTYFWAMIRIIYAALVKYNTVQTLHWLIDGRD